jgi:hypothetical protein
MASVGYAKRLYEGAHRSVTDTLTAYKVMGFTGKSGASATALGSARQYGLVENVKGGVRVSDLGMQILEPSSQEEYAHALHVAANTPSVFERLLSHFEELPRSDEPIRSYLIRQLEFSKSGADDCIVSLRRTLAELNLNEFVQDLELPTAEGQSGQPSDAATGRANSSGAGPAEVVYVPMSELIRIPLAKNCTAELRLIGEITPLAIQRLVQYIELMKDVWAAE